MMDISHWFGRLRQRFAGTPRDWLSPRRKRFWVTIILAAYALSGFLLVPWVARHQIPEVLSEVLERPVTLDQVRVNPFVLSAEARGFKVTEIDGTRLVGFERLYLNFQLPPLYRTRWWMLVGGFVSLVILLAVSVISGWELVRSMAAS